MYTELYLKWITNKDLLYSIWNSAQCYVAAWMRFWGRMDICLCVCVNTHIYIWLSLFTVNLKLSQHCLLISDTSIQNKKFLKRQYDNVMLSEMYD